MATSVEPNLGDVAIRLMHSMVALNMISPSSKASM
jgi:hypothetical protein